MHIRGLGEDCPVLAELFEINILGLKTFAYQRLRGGVGIESLDANHGDPLQLLTTSGYSSYFSFGRCFSIILTGQSYFYTLASSPLFPYPLTFLIFCLPFFPCSYYLIMINSICTSSSLLIELKFFYIISLTLSNYA